MAKKIIIIKNVVIVDKVTNKAIRADYGPFRISKLVLISTLPQAYMQLLVTPYSRGRQTPTYPTFMSLRARKNTAYDKIIL